jgi:hypothetical protein
MLWLLSRGWKIPEPPNTSPSSPLSDLGSATAVEKRNQLVRYRATSPSSIIPLISAANRLSTVANARCSLMRRAAPADGPLQSILQRDLLSGIEEVGKRFRIGHPNSGHIVPTRCSSQMSIRAEGNEVYGVLVQRHIPKRVVEQRCAIERLS